MALTIKKLSKELLDDYLHFFDDIAFCDNPSWSKCYCSFFYYEDDEVLDNITKEETRACVVRRINSGKHNGFMAFIDGEPVGWINAGRKENYDRVMANKDIDYTKGKKVGAIVCFVVDRHHRGKGIATALLRQACIDFQNNGYDLVEAYPRKSPENEAENYHGPLNMYLNNGFEVTKELDHIQVVGKSF